MTPAGIARSDWRLDEYVGVKRWTRDRALLEALGSYRISNELTARLVEDLGAFPPALRFTGRSRTGLRALYDPPARALVLAPFPNLGSVVHEYAHFAHHMATLRWTGAGVSGRASHGRDFADWLDRTAARTQTWLQVEFDWVLPCTSGEAVAS